MDPRTAIYGRGLEGPFEHLKRTVIRTRLTQGGGLLVMAVFLTWAVVYTGQLAFTLFVMFALVFGILPLNEARRFARRMRGLSVSHDGINLPMPLSRWKNTASIAVSDIQAVDLHEHPYGPLVEIRLRQGLPIPLVVIEKDFIFDWRGFVLALQEVGLLDALEGSAKPKRAHEQNLENRYGVRRVRGQFLVLGAIVGMVLAIVLVAIPDKVLGFEIAVPTVVLMTAFLVYVNRRVPLRFHVSANQLTIQTITGPKPFDLSRAVLHVGGSAVTIQRQGEEAEVFEFVDPGELVALNPAIGMTVEFPPD